jgi:exodeoxyribonuclease-3
LSRKVYRSDWEDRFDHEGRTIEADYGDFILYNIYFPNGGMGPERLAFKLDFYDCFLKKVTAQMAAGRNVIVVRRRKYGPP